MHVAPQSVAPSTHADAELAPASPGLTAASIAPPASGAAAAGTQKPLTHTLPPGQSWSWKHCSSELLEHAPAANASDETAAQSHARRVTI
jgi:hypothetical protein